jgi:hypothetical protein
LRGLRRNAKNRFVRLATKRFFCARHAATDAFCGIASNLPLAPNPFSS